VQSRAAESQWCKAGLRSHSGAKQGCGVTAVQSRAAESQWCKAGLRSHSGAKQGCGVTVVQSRAAESQWCKAGLRSHSGAKQGCQVARSLLQPQCCVALSLQKRVEPTTLDVSAIIESPTRPGSLCYCCYEFKVICGESPRHK